MGHRKCTTDHCVALIARTTNRLGVLIVATDNVLTILTVSSSALKCRRLVLVYSNVTT